MPAAAVVLAAVFSAGTFRPVHLQGAQLLHRHRGNSSVCGEQLGDACDGCCAGTMQCGAGKCRPGNDPCADECQRDPSSAGCHACCSTVDHETPWNCDGDKPAACCTTWTPDCYTANTTANNFHGCRYCEVHTTYVYPECVQLSLVDPGTTTPSALNGVYRQQFQQSETEAPLFLRVDDAKALIRCQLPAPFATKRKAAPLGDFTMNPTTTYMWWVVDFPLIPDVCEATRQTMPRIGKRAEDSTGYQDLIASFGANDLTYHQQQYYAYFGVQDPPNLPSNQGVATPTTCPASGTGLSVTADNEAVTVELITGEKTPWLHSPQVDLVSAPVGGFLFRLGTDRRVGLPGIETAVTLSCSGLCEALVYVWHDPPASAATNGALPLTLPDLGFNESSCAPRFTLTSVGALCQYPMTAFRRQLQDGETESFTVGADAAYVAIVGGRGVDCSSNNLDGQSACEEQTAGTLNFCKWTGSSCSDSWCGRAKPPQGGGAGSGTPSAGGSPVVPPGSGPQGGGASSCPQP
eukprot:TRINITY_DN1453_c0_g1_i1.p1 TRINITY_DN1453_c0_g1~~TRINITY_DN1453_c0_g1_i1.p1  ORF type:complete len:538 (+),score=98.66 TRINITY_DN1453_c0_g1_i1:56-1615(+)